MLERIHSPQDLKGLNEDDRALLARDIRERILTCVSENGGHLASSLGAVELTIALHTVLDCPTDKLLFDVGHQAYAHKILTGRADAFATLRKQDGVSGFLRREESPYDVFSTGHASSTLSAALGMARARELRGETYRVVCVVGDGALTGGMCYEALNDAGQTKTPMVVILNDNEMSISGNVGAISNYLTRLRQSTPYRTIKARMRAMLDRVPRFGAPILSMLSKVRDSIKTLLVDGQFFTALGFEYQGPIDGHDTRHLIRVIRRACDAPWPVLIHVVTQKGRGYAPAEARPSDYHGVSPFCLETGLPRGEERPRFGAAAAGMLSELADRDERIAVVAAAMRSGTGMDGFAKAHPNRLFDVGIAEEHAVTLAAGMATSGMKPFVAIYSTFLQRAYDQILEDVCLQNLPVVFLIDRAGLVGADGATHQGLFDVGFLRQMPRMIIGAPRDVQELRRMIALSMTCPGPVAIRYPRDVGASALASDEAVFETGEWARLRAGGDATAFAFGAMLGPCLDAAAALSQRGIELGVVNARYIKPLDESMLDSVARTGSKIVVVEDNMRSGGLGEAVEGWLQANGYHNVVCTLGVDDAFVAHASVAQQMHALGLDAQAIASSVERVVRGATHAQTRG